MILEVSLGLLRLLFVMLISVIIHECGHYLMAESKNLRPKFVWLKGKYGLNDIGVLFDKPKNKQDHHEVLLAGVLAGFICMIVLGMISNMGIISMVAGITYMGHVSMSDFRQLKKLKVNL